MPDKPSPARGDMVALKWTTVFWTKRAANDLDGDFEMEPAGIRCKVVEVRRGGTGTLAEVLLSHVRHNGRGGSQTVWAWVGADACVLETT